MLLKYERVVALMFEALENAEHLSPIQDTSQALPKPHPGPELHVTPNSHEVSEDVRQRLAVIRPAQMGY